MPRVQTSVEIARPREEVFVYLTDLDNAMEWTTGLIDVTYDGQLAEGTAGADTRLMGKKKIVMPWRVTAFDVPSRVRFEYSAPFPATADFTFRSTAAGTLVTCTADLRPQGLWRLLGPVMAREARKADQAQFNKVKEILEGASTTKGN
jgi:carbon monoxide dehydrogenase subunit G